MFTTKDIMRTTAKFDNILSNRPQNPSQSSKIPPYQSLCIIKKLNKGKFPIYLTSSKINNQMYAMKMFCYSRGKPQPYYQNEVRFACLKHPNVVNMVYHENEKSIARNGELKKVSYILTEYAPYGDFFDLVTGLKNQLNEKLVRTYFRQLINGINYLHKNGVAHLDLKPENLLLGADFNLKVTDFDLSHIDGDTAVLSRGTHCYRAPEFFLDESNTFSDAELEDLFAADIYSAGIILFILMSGIFPHTEFQALNGTNFLDLIYNNNSEFWAKHCKIQRRDKSFYSDDFKALFNGMVSSDPRQRVTIKDIKKSKWYNGPIYTPEELCEKMENLLDC